MNEEKFRQLFVAPMIECYGQTRLPPVKIKYFWERMQKFPEHVVRQCADRIILNHETFPGVTNALQTCSEIIRAHNAKAAAEVQVGKQCFSCGNQGVKVINNHAYRCTCDLGPMLYPAFPEYSGQTGKILLDMDFWLMQTPRPLTLTLKQTWT